LGRPEYLRRLSHQGRNRPLMLICETVNICNNDCVMCPYGVLERKKTHMSMPLFEKVARDYAAMGGGILSLTPMVGEVFLDKLLPQRVRVAAAEPAITGLTVTTNATPADRYSRGELAEMLRGLTRVHVSIYGL